MREDRRPDRLAVGLASFAVEIVKPPRDLRERYVTLGKDQLEAFYGKRKTVIERWLSEIDEEVLKKRRRAFVKQQRRQLRPLSSRVRRLTIVEDARPVNHRVVAAAAHFLRVSRNGGWIVSRTQFGDWYVGRMKMSPHQLIEFAVSKGFDPDPALHSVAPPEVNS